MISYIGQTFGNRVVIADRCQDSDWLDIGKKIPSEPRKYRLTKCLNCGRVMPTLTTNLLKTPPKKCVFCSNIGNHSGVSVATNTWAAYETYAVCNITTTDGIVSTYISIDDYDAARNYTWRVSKKRQKYYVVSGSFKKGTQLYLHNMVAGKVDGLEVDHIDGNSLNNRRENLRMVSRQDNIDNQRATRIDNKIGIRGIAYSTRDKCFKVDFNYHGVRFYTKHWSSIEEAVWCRKCFEDFFGINALASNPLAEQYYTLPDVKRVEIEQYVHQQILGNERYESLHSSQQLPEDPQGRV